MEVLVVDDRDDEGGGRPSEIELASMRDYRSTLAEAAMADLRGSALTEAAMPDYGSALAQEATTHLLSAGDFLHLAGFDGGKFGEGLVRYTDIDGRIAAVAKTMWEESEAVRRFQEMVRGTVAGTVMSTIQADAKFILPDDYLRGVADATFGLSDNPMRGLADTSFASSLNQTFGMAGGLNLERESIYGAALATDLDFGLGSAVVIPPADFLFADTFRHDEVAGLVPRHFVDLILELVPRPDRWLIGDRYCRPTYSVPPVDDTADPLPHDAVLIHELRVSGGSLAQIGNLFEHFFGPARSPERCFVVRERQEARWTIYHAEHTDRDARERASDANAAGFIVVVDLPVAIVEVYGVADGHRSQIASFAEQLKKRMTAVGFSFEALVRKSYGQWAGTEAKIEDLKGIREDSRKGGIIKIGRLAACQLAGIDAKTVKKHAPELYARWEEWDY